MSDLDRRRRNIMWLGGLMLIGFFMPVWSPLSEEPWGLSVPNIQALFHASVAQPGDPGHPAYVACFLLAYPLIAAAALFALSAGAKPLVRGIGLTVLGVLPWAVLWGDSFFRSNDIGSSRGILEALLRDHRGDGLVLWLWLVPFIIMGNLAWIGLFVGSRARWYRPSSQVAHAFGIGGATLFIACLVFPLLLNMSYRAFFPYSESWSDRADPGLPVIFFYGLYAAWAFMAATVVFCLLNSARNDVETARRRARSAFRMFLLAHGVLALVLFVSVIVEVYGPGNSGFAIVGFIAFLKLLMLGAPVLLLIPVGLSDLIVGKGEPLPSASVPSGATPPLMPPLPGPGGTAPA